MVIGANIKSKNKTGVEKWQEYLSQDLRMGLDN